MSGARRARRTGRLAEALVLGLVLAGALALRWTTLDIPHYGSDEPWNEGLAASLLGGGPYTLRHVDVRASTVRTGNSRRTVSLTSWVTTSSGSERGSSTVNRTSMA